MPVAINKIKLERKGAYLIFSYYQRKASAIAAFRRYTYLRMVKSENS